jgi:lipoprotein-releasing system permease protein
MPAAPPARMPGVIVGYSIAHYRYKDPVTGAAEDRPLLRPGDDVLIATVGATGDKVVYGSFIVTDYFRSEMSEYDGGFVYVPLDDLQRVRGMGDRVNSVHVKLNGDRADDSRFVHEAVVPELAARFDPAEARVASWQQQQGPLLAAIDIERGILNLLLFLIVGVAGFSVLAIFTMIVSEKIRDIGLLKSLGASNRGVMGIFLTYGLTLGLIGCGLGTAAGLLITEYINEIEAGLARLTGQQIFDRSVYYFDKIPTNVDPVSVALVNLGAVFTAVAFSVLPALRAARLHPVKALRFE